MACGSCNEDQTLQSHFTKATLLKETQLCSLHFPEPVTQQFGFHGFQKWPVADHCLDLEFIIADINVFCIKL